MKKVRLKVGQVFQIPLSNGMFAYCRLFREDHLCVYKTITQEPGKPPIGSRDYFFQVCMHDIALKNGEFPLVGIDPFENGESDLPWPTYILCPITEKYSIYNNGKVRCATKEECAGLDETTVLHAEHVLARIESILRLSKSASSQDHKNAVESALNSIVIVEDWDTVVGEYENKPVFVSFDKTTTNKSLRRLLSHCARIMIPILKPNRNGGPGKKESTLLSAMEDAICDLLSKHNVECRLVARLTYQGMREFVFQFADFDTFRPIVGIWATETNNDKIDISEHEGWSFFDSLFPKNK
jgi:hypothetical protein